MAPVDLDALRPSVAWVGNRIEIIDQTRLPSEFVILELVTVDAVVDAIYRLAVRGAPAIGACGALGLVVGLDERRPRDTSSARTTLVDFANMIGSARPTAVNLRWAVERVRDAASAGETVDEIRALALTEALTIIDEVRHACTKIGEYGRVELAGIVNIMTHCNTGRLATAGWGTALGVIYAKAAAGESVKVMASETRPLLQGARLTTWELQNAGIDVTLMTDGSAAAAMVQGKVEAVIVGADRIAANGDTANKIGTFSHAVNADRAGIPFYVAAPLSTFDLNLASGTGIEIELRDGHELTSWRSEPTAPNDVPTWNPAFDVTPAELITGIITEVGVLHPPFEDSIRSAFTAGGKQ
ncbi:MAG: S-methyl-5-thioribose-1-phosphate isomerase [Acidimicrobiia bacterium]|nr:S-methyl-5-thioribose-1-phosphate isomerase [Acidimicrobiia bacterium]